MNTSAITLPPPQSRLIVALAVIAWLMLLAASCVYWLARPEEETFLDRRWDKTVRSDWDGDLASLGLKLLQANLALGGGGLLLNLVQVGAGGKRFNVSLLAATLLTVIGLLLFTVPD